MTWTDDEASQSDGGPIEGYEFVGSATTWRYTSDSDPVTIDGNSYTPLAALIRGEVTLGTLKDTPTLTVALPSTTTLVAHYGFNVPPKDLALNVYRKQSVSAEWQTIWTGTVTGLTPKGLMTHIECPGLLGARLGCTVSSLSVRLFCNHTLYDERCRVDPAGFDFTTTVLGVSADGMTVTLSGIGGNPNQWFRAGKITRDADGESRTVIDQVGVVLKLHAPFRTLGNPDAVTLLAGCQHDTNICDTKFSNLANYGGFPKLLQYNPFLRPLELGGS